VDATDRMFLRFKAAADPAALPPAPLAPNDPFFRPYAEAQARINGIRPPQPPGPGDLVPDRVPLRFQTERLPPTGQRITQPPPAPPRTGTGSTMIGPGTELKPRAERQAPPAPGTAPVPPAPRPAPRPNPGRGGYTVVSPGGTSIVPAPKGPSGPLGGTAKPPAAPAAPKP
jgi:hypothetical protein